MRALWVGVMVLVLAMGTAFGQAPGLVLGGDAKGLTSMTYRGQELLVKGPASVAITVATADGKTTNLQDVKDANCTAVGDTITRTFPGAELLTKITQEGDTLKLVVTLRNTGDQPITRLSYKPFTFQFPKRPQGGSWKWGYRVATNNEGEPGVVEANWGAAKVLACVDEIERPITFGFDGNYGNSTTNALVIEKSLALGPGEAVTYPFSLRFAPADADAQALVKDLYAQFAEAYPYALAWDDRRPIGAIFMCTSGTKWATNPRGWFNDPKVDVTTPEGVKAFGERLMKYADTCVKEMTSVGAQGMILWSVEGEQMPHAITYLGDPRVLPECAPEMDAYADAFFKKFTDAGLKVGVCIRPSKVIPDGKGGWKHQQVDDHVAEMADKIAYAKRRWGCTIFYMDTNVKWPMKDDSTRGMWQGNASVLASRDLHELYAKHPDVLIFPEFGRIGYWGACMPYGELRAGTTRTRDSIKAIYPKAGSTITIGDGDYLGQWNNLRQGVLGGDIHLFRGWFTDPPNRHVKNMYSEVDYIRRSASVKLEGTLAQQLANPDPLVRYTALTILTAPTAEQAALITGLLPQEGEWVVKKQMVEVLGVAKHAAAVPALLPLLKDPKSNLDTFAGNALAQIGPAATEALLPLADGKDVRLTEKALGALARYEDAKALPVLLPLTEHANPTIFRAAVRALGAQKDAAATARLVAMLKGNDADMLIDVCRALGRTKDRAAIPALVETIERAARELKNNNLRVAAGDALEAITGQEFGPYEGRWRKALNEGKL